MKKILLFLTVFSGLLLTSCYKEPENGIATIKVIDENDLRVPNATVTLTGPTGSFINVSGITNFSGEWSYEHDPALEVILNVYAINEDGTKDGFDIVRIVPDKTAAETVKIQ